MTHEQRFPGLTASRSITVSPFSGGDKGLIQGFLLSRDVIDCTRRTITDYRQRLGRYAGFIASEFPRISLKEVQRQHVEAYLLSIKHRGCAPWTVRTNYRALHAFYHWMAEEDFVAVSPMSKIKPPRVPKVGKPFLSISQFTQLCDVCALNTFTGARTAAMLWILWGTGMRREELAGLMIADVDWDAGCIRVFGKGRKERYVPLTKDARKAIYKYLKFRDDALPYLWLTEERTAMRSNGVCVSIRRTYERAGLSVKDAFHIFRRTWAMRNLKAGVPMKHVQLIGGWEDISTLEVYVRMMDSTDALAARWV